MHFTGAWPSGKATDFESVIRRFESYRPSLRRGNQNYPSLNSAIFAVIGSVLDEPSSYRYMVVRPGPARVWAAPRPFLLSTHC